MKQWWQQLKSRDQLIISISLIISAVVLFYLFIGLPISTAIQNSRTYVHYQYSLIEWMKQSKEQLLQLKTSATPIQKIDESQLLAVLDSSLQEANLKHSVVSIQQSGENKILVKFKAIVFDKLIDWLREMWQQHGIKVAQLEITANKNISGAVEAEIFLKV